MDSKKNSTPSIIDERMRLNVLDENTRNAYMRKEHTADYDRSVFVECQQNNDNGERRLYVPSPKRVDWFIADNPDGIVYTEPPVIIGHYFSITAKVFRNRADRESGMFAAMHQYNGNLNINDASKDLNSCATRAMGRALRNIGYDLPRDAHEIPGWTPIKIIDSKSVIPDDALESSVVVKSFLPPMSLVKGTIERDKKKTVNETNSIEDAPGDKATPSTSTPAKNNAPAMTQDEPSTQMAPTVMPAAVKVMADPVVADEVKTAKEPRSEAVVSIQARGNADKTNGGSAADAAPLTITEILEKAHETFDSISAAEAYSSYLLGRKSVGEQNDMRIKYYAKKAVVGVVKDEKLGLACVMVADNRKLDIA